MPGSGAAIRPLAESISSLRRACGLTLFLPNKWRLLLFWDTCFAAVAGVEGWRKKKHSRCGGATLALTSNHNTRHLHFLDCPKRTRDAQGTNFHGRVPPHNHYRIHYELASTTSRHNHLTSSISEGKVFSLRRLPTTIPCILWQFETVEATQ